MIIRCRGIGRGATADKSLSEERGVTPILAAIADVMNNYILAPICNGKYQFEWTGATPATDETLHQRLIEATKSYMTSNNARAVWGLPPVANGDHILDPNAGDQVEDAAVRIQRMGMPDPSDKSSALQQSSNNKKSLDLMGDWE